MRVAARRWAGCGGRATAYLVLAFTALLIALAVTPPVPLTVFGQNVEVGAVPPTPSLGWSGPGQAELFGEGSVDTALQFPGLIRPRIAWRNFNRDAAASDFIETSTTDGRRTVRTNTAAVGEALAGGWSSFFVRLVAVAGLAGGVLYLVGIAVVGMVRGAHWRPRHSRHPVWRLALSVLLAMAATGASAALTVVTAREQLGKVATLADITGTAPLVPIPAAVGPPRGDVAVAVVGDSTAAGVGNAPLSEPADLDKTCGRSRDAYARVLQTATGMPVDSLACSSATISAGLLGSQVEGAARIPPQVGLLKSMTSLRVVIVSVGANDVGWSDFLKYCYGLPRCDDQLSDGLMKSRLDAFRLQYVQLLQQLSDLPTHPAVIVSGYYDPFGDSFDCPALQDPQAPLYPPTGYGFAADPGQDNQPAKVRQKIEPLRSALSQLNTVLRQGAEGFGFKSVRPTFDGHALCSAQPWVQGLSGAYPFHPNAAGELAIAAAILPSLAAIMTG
ncbi:MAG: GDSL-type esterase/lipase family protein [Dermatophilaceae bacterium]